MTQPRGVLSGRLYLATFLHLLIFSQSDSVTPPEKYDANTRPNNGGVADVISVSVGTLTIREVDETLQKISMECTFHTFWEDKRLLNLVERETVFGPNKHADIWTPHLSIMNSAESPIRSGNALSLKPDGTVDYSERISAKISCEMSMMRYPFGKQHCKTRLSSYGHSSLHLILLWNGILSPLNINIFDPEYSVHHIEQTSERHKTLSGEFSYLNIEITLRRSPLRIITYALFPTLLFAGLSYFITFFMKRGEPENASKSKNNKKSDNKTLEEDPEESIQKPEEESEELRNNNIQTRLSSISHSSFPSYFAFDLILRVGVNVFILLIVVLIQQINSVSSPRSSAPTALDVWMGFMLLTTFTCFIVGLILCFRTWRYFLQGKMSHSKENDLMLKIVHILRISIPVIFFIFIISFIGVCVL